MTFFSCRLLTTPIFPRRLSNFSDPPSDATGDWKLLEGENMGMGMKSLKWEEIGTKNLFPALYTIKFMFLVCGPYILRVYGSSSYMKVIGSRSKSQARSLPVRRQHKLRAAVNQRVCCVASRYLLHELFSRNNKISLKVKGQGQRSPEFTVK